jgi:hypothetical protein
MAQEVLAGSVLFGVVLVAIVAYLSGRGWRTYAPAGGFAGDGESPLSRAARSPAVWTLAFVLGTVAAGVAAVAFVDGSVPEALQRNAGIVLAGGAALVLTGYLYYGTYVSARNRGLMRSQAALLGSWSVAMLALVVITLRLVGLV